MYKILIILCCLILTVVIFSCKGEQKSESKMQQEEQTTTVMPDTGQATCPVCGMTMAKSEMIAQEIDGEMYYFCSEADRDTYLAQHEESEEMEEEPEEE